MKKLLLLLPLMMACGEEGKETEDTDEEVFDPLTCEVLDGDNCWKQSMVEAAACLPADTEGTFSADRTTCSFTDGSQVVFAEALPEDLSGFHFDFALDDPTGSECMRYAGTEDSNSLSTASGTTEQRPWEIMGMALECPDETLYVMESAFGLMECDWAVLPGTATSWSGGNMSFSLSGGGDQADFSFSCTPA